MLQKKGFENYVEYRNDDEVLTYFYSEKLNNLPDDNQDIKLINLVDFQLVKEKFNTDIIEIDVRHLEMPLPMLTILENLEKLPESFALFVNLKKYPFIYFPNLKNEILNFIFVKLMKAM